MNQTLRFGYQDFGNHKLVKINAKMTKDYADSIYNNFPDLCVIHKGNDSYRIEGCIYFNQVSNFDMALKLACIDFKIIALQQKAFEIETNAIYTEDAFTVDIN